MRLFGAGGDDHLKGNGGNDSLSGGEGADVMEGGAGDDYYVVDNIGDIVLEKSGNGTDTVQALLSLTLADNVENGIIGGTDNLDLTGNGLGNNLTGNAGMNTLSGGGGGDTLRGGPGHDTLIGGTGKDVLIGGLGDDTLIGGRDKDILTGGLGGDIFDFNSIRDSVRGSGRDKILDFARGADDIDLKSIDAKKGVSGDQKFKWIGKHDFHDKKGELHYVEKGSKVIVEGDVNGDGKADFQIWVAADHLTKGDFVL